MNGIHHLTRGGQGGGPRRPGQIIQRNQGGVGSQTSRASSQAHLNPGGGQTISLGVDDRSKRDRVEICSIDDFLDNGELYLYDYGVDLAFFIAKSRGGTCTLAYSDPPALVRNRAHFLCNNFCFGAYNLFYNNCEDFAIYCKTGLIVPRIITIGRSGQTTACAALICALISIPYSLLTGSNFVGVSVVGYVLYSIWRLFSDTGYRTDARKVPFEGLAAFQTFIAFMYRQLLFTLIPKFLCYAILIRTFWFPEATWTIQSQNSLLNWIITVAFLWAAFF
ncbi:protein LEAD-SENSITIVE 1-like [Ziziphus jujuba]|uniref:Protein LEAD-SENSITIVE 1-like n=1 Tax=Ziziphus jujuba TaxID=326968 RepID=A0ABM4A803_ZIZJJ|nr:protein LEAD-SENSITIVE 1-like [Ziziphus jujuba]